MDKASFFNGTRIEPLLTQNNNMCFASHSFLHLDQSFFIYINFHLCRFVCQKAGSAFRDPRFLGFFCSIEPSLRLCDGSISTSPSWGLLLDSKWWQSSTNPGSTGTSISSRIVSTLVSNSLPLTLGGMPEISRHSLLEYCPFAKYLLSTLISLSDSLELTFLDMFTSALVVQ